MLQFRSTFILLLLITISARSAPGPQEIRNLCAFARLYGYVRYFHPSDETQLVNWDHFAIYGSSVVRKAENDDALLASLRQLFLPMAPSIKIFKRTDKTTFNIKDITPASLAGYHEISWQYTGLSMRLVNDFARLGTPTVRLNRSASDKKEKVIADSLLSGTQAQFIPASHAGSEFRLSASFKLISDNGASAGIGLTNISASGQGSSFTTPVHNESNSSWKQYTLAGKIDKLSQQLLIGISLKGKGVLLVKDLQFIAVEDGKEYPIQLPNQDFTVADADGRPMAWINPAADNGHYQFEVTPEPTSASGAAMKISFKAGQPLDKKADAPLYAYQAKVGDVVNKELVPGIQCIVPIALYGTTDATYPSGNKAALAALINATAAIPEPLTADSLQVRLGDIVIAWNIYRHFFPFWQDVAVKPEQLLQHAFTKAYEDKNPADFKHTLQLMTAPLKDGHLWVVMKTDSAYNAMAPVTFSTANHQVLVKDVLDPDLQAIIKPGDVTDSINGKTAWQQVEEISRHDAGSTQRNLHQGLWKLSFGYPGSKMQMTLSRDHKRYRVLVNRSVTGFDEKVSLLQKLPASGTTVASNIYYINLLEPGDKVDSLIRIAAGAKAIIFDMRGYPGYDLFEMVLSRLITEKVGSPGILYDPQIIYPDFEKVKYTRSPLDVSPRTPHLTARCYFLTDASIGSHPEYFLAFIKHYKLATIVGQPTAGIDGTINGFYLPGGYELTFTGIRVDGLPGHHRLDGVTPDVIVNPSMPGIKAGKDEIYETALKLATHDKH
ncbi:S41 family peptidase [Chitinophaga filiformis]|uniref:Peptidase family S41 n=1 Tax=Chitinophaga filiformis TaxID=104663 RepID=A0A1G7LQC9_CHIFI|nr:S41 family peptidase [Chitinophaga filiformis]SDF51722.1 Peptidase family S41 [Chitinophaga filiformis]